MAAWYASSYNYGLVLISLLVAMLASYTALDMAGRIEAAQGRGPRVWLAGGSLAMGTGIWSMHFVAMLAFRLPIAMGYDPGITALSWLIAVVSSAFALWLVGQRELSRQRLAWGAVLMGSGVAAMHYTGMAAMRMHPGIVYRAGWLVASVAIAIAASGAALWIAFHLRRPGAGVRMRRAGAAVVMGLAIVGMHFSGMAAARFPAGSACAAARAGVTNGWLALLVIVATLAVLALALVISVLDSRLESRTSVLAASLANANRELTYLALHDSLTKLPNRVLLEEQLERAQARAQGEGGQLALLFVDLDGFKMVNDSYGHYVGDLLLAEAAKRLQAHIAANDIVARIGGDEFVVLTQTGPVGAEGLAQAMAKAIAAPFQLQGHEVRVTASIGIAAGDDGIGGLELMANADAAMYHAKAQGRNSICVFEASMRAHIHDQLALLNDLRMALERQELALYYQPKVEAASQRIIGAEALLRWIHPARGIILPAQFIGLAEASGLIVSMGEWVVNEACRQIAVWTPELPADWTLAVNLSPLQFGHADLARMVRAALARHGVEPRRLTLEITESTAMGNAGATLIILQELVDLGVNISLDDFGTGYSSLLYLKRLPASELKIDAGFVRDLAPGTEDAAIVSAIVALGATLGLNVVAEGVETALQQDQLQALGCNALQGFRLGHPVPASELRLPQAPARAGSASASARRTGLTAMVPNRA